MGLFALNVAIGGKPVDQVKALILLSHGIGGFDCDAFLKQTFMEISAFFDKTLP